MGDTLSKEEERRGGGWEWEGCAAAGRVLMTSRVGWTRSNWAHGPVWLGSRSKPTIAGHDLFFLVLFFLLLAVCFFS